jgi:hypothetical protein
MSENINNTEEKREEKKTFTAVDLAKAVVDTTSIALPYLAEISKDPEAQAKLREALLKLQQMAMEYLYRAAQNANRRRATNTWKRNQWRKWR